MTKRLVYVFTTASMPWYFQKEQNLFLRAHGFDLHLIASPDDFLEKICPRDGLTVHPLDIPRSPSPWRDLAALVRLVRLFWKLQPNIVYGGAPKSALLAMLAARLAGVKTRFYACHGTVTERQRGLKRLFYRFVEGLTARLATRVWCVSPSLLAFISRAGILPKGQGFTIGQGSANGFREEWLNEPGAVVPEAIARLEKAKAASDFPVAGYMGRLCGQKGLETIAAAWPVIRKQVPEARLLLIGSWERVGAAPKSCRKRLESDPSVIIPGLVEQGAAGRCYRLMDVLLLPSLGGEGFSNTLLEAALCGVPAVTSKIVGCIDAVADGVTGRIIPPGDAAALASAVTEYLQNPGLAQAHGEAGRKRALKDFRPEPIWAGLLAEYSSCTA
jgi:glycosyltransferase involved in cell wall biosynthesis